MSEVDNFAAVGMISEKRIRKLYKQSVARFGINHTHDVMCRTWRGQNWAGACDCTLPDRMERYEKTRVGTHGRCQAHVRHDPHIFSIGVVDTAGNTVLQECPGQYSDCSNCDDRYCMACVMREIHDHCAKDCPMCCV